jgi:integrase/recombinase XerD
MTRTNPQKKAKELAKLLRNERPDYHYLKAVFRHLRTELNVSVVTKAKSLPDIPTEDEMKQYYEIVWSGKNTQDLLIVKLVNIKLSDVDFKRLQIRIESGKGGKDRMVPFPESFKEILAMHVNDMKVSGATHLFESSWKKLYTDRGIRKILQRYATAAGLTKTISPHKLRHFLFTWLKKQGLDDAMIQPYSGHASRQSLEIYSRMSLAAAQEEYDQAIKKFPV